MKSCKTNPFDTDPARAITVDKEPTSKIYKNCLKLWNRAINVQELGKNRLLKYFGSIYSSNAQQKITKKNSPQAISFS